MLLRFQVITTIVLILLVVGGCSTTFSPETPRSGPRVILKTTAADAQKAPEPDAKVPDYLALARDLVAQGNPQYYDSAWVFLDKAAAGDGPQPEVDYLRGIIRREKGDVEGARDYFAAAVAASPAYADAYQALGKSYGVEGELDKALAHYRKALAIEPNRVEFNNDMGYLLMSAGDTHSAEPYLRKSIAAPTPPDFAVNNLALCLGLNGSPEEAFEVLRQHQPPAMAHNNMGVIYRSKGDIDKALAMFREALRLDPELTVAAVNLEEMLRLENRN